MLLPYRSGCSFSFPLPFKSQPFLHWRLFLGIHSVFGNFCHFESIRFVPQQSRIYKYGRKEILNRIHHILWQPRLSQGCYFWFSGFSRMRSWTLTRRWLWCRRIWDIGSCWVRSYIWSLWQISCITTSRHLCTELTPSSYPPISDTHICDPTSTIYHLRHKISNRIK